MAPRTNVQSTKRSSTPASDDATTSSSSASPRHPYAAAPLLVPDADMSRSYVPADTPRYSVPFPGQHATGLLGDAFKDQPLYKRLNWLHVPLLTITPLLALVGCSMWTCVATAKSDPRPRCRAFVTRTRDPPGNASPRAGRQDSSPARSPPPLPAPRRFNMKTFGFAIFYYFFTGLGITAGACRR